MRLEGFFPKISPVIGIVLIGLGGGLGSLLRHAPSGTAQRRARGSTFPIGAIAVNQADR